jgi:integrase
LTRTYGTGTYSRVRPGVWRFRVSAKDPITDKPIQVSKTVHLPVRTGKKDLEKVLGAFRSEIEGRRASGAAMTFGRVLTDWLADLEREGRAKTTLETYGYHIEGKIRPALGDLPLEKIDPARIRAFMGSLGGSVRTQRLTHAILRGALSFAVVSDWIATNPASRVKAPRVNEEETEALTPEQIATLITAGSRQDPVLGVTIALTAAVGCRRGEAVGLKWSDVDWDAETIRIERAWVTGTGGQHLTTTKTKEKRTVSLRGYGMTVLREWHAHQTARYGELGPWLLSDSDGSEPLSARWVTMTFTALCRANGIEDTHYHDVRHFASTQLQDKTDAKTAASRLGHSPKVMLETYAHAIAERDALAAVALGDVIAKALAAPKEK